MTNNHAIFDEINSVMTDPSASSWVKAAFEAAIERDPVDAVNDAEFLLAALTRRLDSGFRVDKPLSHNS